MTYEDNAAFAAASPTGDAYVTLGRSTPGDGGGGLWVGAASEPASEPKLYVPAVTRWFRAGETEQTLLRFGALGTGLLADIAANNQALTDARDWMLENVVAVTVSDNARPPRLIIPHGVYRYDAYVNWGMPYLDIEGRGGATLFFEGAVGSEVGSGRALTIVAHDGEDYVSGYRGAKVRGLILEGGSSVQGGLYLEAMHDARIDLNCRSVGTGAFTRAFEIRFSVSSEFNLRSSVNEGAFLGSSVPAYGVYVDALTGENDQYTVNCLFNRGVYEGVGTGINLVRAADCLFLGGTSEGNTANGMYVSGFANRNIFKSIYMEANTNFDIYCEGHGNVFEDLLCYDHVRLTGSANMNQFVRGNYTSIELASAAVADTRFNETTYNAGNTGAVITNNGTRTYGTAINAITRTRTTYTGS